MTIKDLLKKIAKDIIRQESEVKTKIIYPILDILRFQRQNIVDEFPVYSNSGRQQMHPKPVDMMVFMLEGANKHFKRNDDDINWVRENSLIAIELKKPDEKIEKAKEQATFYAMWTRTIIYMITNGIDIEIYRLENYNADQLLFRGKIMELDVRWNELYNTLNFSNLIRIKKKQLPKPVIISNNYWDEINYEDERDITDAIKGNKLFPYNVKSCPKLPIINKLENDIELSNYCIIKGPSGCGKSITAYQLGFIYYQQGYKIFRYKNNDDEFDYNLKDLIYDKTIFIIDDFQNLKSISIDKLLSNTSNKLKIIITITDGVSIDAETTYLSSSQSVKYIYDYYLKNKKDIYKIVHNIDPSVGDSFPLETIESRLEKAYKEGQNSPWMFNYILRGGWNIARNDYYQARDNNRSDLLLLYISMKQIALLDKPISDNDLNKLLSIINLDKTWLERSLNYLIKNKIIIKEEIGYRCAHIKYASLIILKMSYDLEMEEKHIIIDMFHQIVIDKNTNLQGIGWILNEFRTTQLTYYRKHIISDKIWMFIKDKCFSVTDEIGIRNSCIVLEASLRFYVDGKKEIIHDKIDLICNWINNINYTTGFALEHLINDLLDYCNKNSEVNNSFKNKIDFTRIANIVNNSDIKTLGAIGNFLERLFIFNDDEWKHQLADNLNIQSIINNIDKEKEKIDIWSISSFISALYSIDNKKGLGLYDKIESIFINSIYKNGLETYEKIDDRLLWNVFGFPIFDNKKPPKYGFSRVKKLLKNINIDDIAERICNSNNYDWERYARFINLINSVDKSISNKIIKKINFTLFEKNLNDYWKLPSSEMRLILWELYCTDDSNLIKHLIHKNINKIEIAEPVFTYICPEIIEHSIINNKPIDIFGFNDSFENALEMLKVVEKYYPQYLNETILPSCNNISNKIESIVPMTGFSNSSISDFLDFIDCKNSDLSKKIFQNIDPTLTTISLKRYNAEKKRNKYANITLLKICQYIVKYNTELKEFAENIIDNISAKYKK